MSHSVIYVRLIIPEIWSEDVTINNRLRHKNKYCFENIVIISNEKTIEVMADKKLCLNWRIVWNISVNIVPHIVCDSQLALYLDKSDSNFSYTEYSDECYDRQ